jgi:hypothetical protein
MSRAGFSNEKDCFGEAKQNWKLETRTLNREDAPYQQTRNCLEIIKERKWKIGHWSQIGGRHQDSLADWPSFKI